MFEAKKMGQMIVLRKVLSVAAFLMLRAAAALLGDLGTDDRRYRYCSNSTRWYRYVLRYVTLP
jgi:hypothetical protein